MIGILCLELFLLAGIVHGQELDSIEPSQSASTDPRPKVTASERIEYNMARDVVTATGDVVVERDDFRLMADTVRYSPSTREAEAQGAVRMRSDEGDFSGDRLAVNLENQSGTFSDGTLFFRENNMHVRAGTISKTGPDSYHAEDAAITTCDGDSPAWEVTGKKVDVTVGEYGFVNHAFLRLKEVPVLYTPFMFFPLKEERQSGLLAPSFDYSDRKGFQYSQPVYWAINDSSDATFYLDYMAERGEKIGTEYRYLLSDGDKGVIMFDFLDDLKVDDGTGTSSLDWGYTGDGYLRPDSERYWFRMKQDLTVGEQGALMLDLDIVSDQDYLYEFKRDNSGYETSNSLFLNLFNRELDGYSDRVRKNRLSFSTQWPGYTLNTEALWWDNVIARTQDVDDQTVKYLPTIYFDGYRKPLWDTPLYAAFSTQSAYLYSEDGNRGGRIDLYPRIYLPYRLGNALNIEPSIGGRETLWQIDRFDEENENRERTRHRELYDVNLNLSTDIYRVFRTEWAGVDALKHAAKFEVEYAYIPTLDQDDYPYFDGIDRIDGENLITGSWINTFTTRSGAEDDRTYYQVARFKLSQSYDINKARDNDPEPFGPIVGDLQLGLGPMGYLQTDAEWSTYSGTFLSRNIAYQFSDERGDRFSIQHRYTAGSLNTLLTGATLKLMESIWLFPWYEMNLRDHHMVGRGLDFVYRARCWSVETRYEEAYEDADTNDWHVGITFTLYGLGDLGSGSLHNEGMPSWASAGF